MDKTLKIYNVFNSFSSYGGAEIIAINITRGLAENGYDVSLLSFTNESEYNIKYEINDIGRLLISFGFLFELGESDLLISHHRKITTFLLLFKYVFFRSYKVIHVAHNEFYNLKWFTLFPKQIIAVSEKVKRNIVDYFRVNDNDITVIYNGVIDKQENDNVSIKYSPTIKILVPARVNKVKQQIEIVSNLAGIENENIEIHFAGVGEDLEALKEIVKDKPLFKVLGFQSIDHIISDYDYVMLFSKVEGLPTVFLEAFMHCKPIICNNAGGNLEILENGINGYYAETFEDLNKIICNLPLNTSEEYFKLCVNARKKYESAFTLDKMIKAYIKVINQ